MKLVALKRIHRYHPGDVFEVNGTQARVLKALKKAEDAPTPEPPVKEAPPRHADPAPAAAEPAPAERAVPRFYRRRDMKPED
jgi:hypothetical protein